MKKHQFTYILLFAGILAVTSCKKGFFTDINNNPNESTVATPSLLLSTVEGAMGYTQGGDFSRYASLITQQTYGYQNQTAQFYFYLINAGTFDNMWGDLYTSVMENDYTLIKLCDDNGYNAYGGISRIMMAYALQVAVDMWGDVPYSQSFQANQPSLNFKPTFDNSKSLYDTITHLIDAGIAKLNDADAGVLTPGSEDAIYNGDAAKWIKFGHAIKARLYIHQSKDDAQMATNALAELGMAFSNESDNAQFPFGSDQTSANPWYQFGRDRQAYITFSNSSLAQMLTDLNDPRYPVFIDADNDGGGSSPSGSYFGGLPDFYGSISAPVEFITYEELLFMKAEATLRTTGNIVMAQSFYQQAITSNMQKLGVSDADITTYLSANGTLPATAGAAISKVASQEYIALFLNPETFTVWRRTGSPSLLPTGTGDVPRRFIYPQTEYAYNGANTPTSTLYTPKVFWDK